MEVAASAFAVGSIAIQLVDSVKKLSDFWKSVKAAPLDVQIIINDLDQLRQVFNDIAHDAQHSQPDATLEKVLQNCKVNVQSLDSVLKELEPGFASTRRRIRMWTAFRSVLKWEKLKQFQDVLDRLKTTLMLVLQNKENHAIRALSALSQQQKDSLLAIENRLQRLGLSERSNIPFDAILYTNYQSANTVSCRCDDSPQEGDSKTEESLLDQKLPVADRLPRKLGSWWNKYLVYDNDWIMKSMCGDFRVYSRYMCLHLASSEEHDEYVGRKASFENRSLIYIRPAGWMSIFGFENGLTLNLIRSSTHGWMSTISPFRPVPDNAPIFELCKEGNLSAVRILFSTGNSSVKDTDSIGRQPLHFAARYLHTELCEFLIEEGADRASKARSPIWIADITPLSEACSDTVSAVTTERIMSTIRLFLNTVDFSDFLGNGWHIVKRIAELPIWIDEKNYNPHELFQWFVNLCFEQVQDEFTVTGYKLALRWLRYEYSKGSLPLWLRLGPKDAIEIQIDGFTTLLWRIRSSNKEYPNSIIEALECGADPNCRGKHEDTSPLWESPSSLSMYSLYSFRTWMFALHKAELDVSDVIDKELRQGILSELDWTQKPFYKLVEWANGQQSTPAGLYCTFCKNHMYHELILQPTWIYTVEQIRSGKHTEDTLWNVLERSKTIDDNNSDAVEPFDMHQEPSDNENAETELLDMDESTQIRSFELDEDIILNLRTKFHTSHQHLLDSQMGDSDSEMDEQDECLAEAEDFDLDEWASLGNEDEVCMRCWLKLLNINPCEESFHAYKRFIEDEDSDVDSERETDTSSTSD